MRVPPRLLAPALAVLAGCATSASTDGSFASASPAVSRKLADDAVAKLAALYPPATTRFELRNAPADAFGTMLVVTLRQRGYALQEGKPAKATADPRTASRVLSYVIDHPGDPVLYRITLTIDAQSLSRIYLAKDDGAAPAGYWMRKE
jgi:hypothetical protein